MALGRARPAPRERTGCHRFLPVGFTRRPSSGLGSCGDSPSGRSAARPGRSACDRPAGGAKLARAVHVDLLVVEGGVAGLAAAAEAAAAGSRVMLVEERRPGATVWDAVRSHGSRRLAAGGDGGGRAILEHHTAVGVYEGPFVPVVGPDRGSAHRGCSRDRGDRRRRSTRGLPGNDLPGVFLSRGAALLGVRHGVGPGRRAVVVATTDEGAPRRRRSGPLAWRC